jgi:hypothetical protein
MIQTQPSSIDGRSSALALILSQCDFDFPKLSASGKRLNWKRLQAVLIQWQLNVQGGKFTANRLQFMAYNCYGFTAAEFAAAFPDIIQPLPPPPASILPAAPTAAQIAVHNSQAALYEAFVTCRDQLKFILEYLFKAEIAHMAHDLTALANVSCSDIYAEVYPIHGRMIAEDIAILRKATSTPVDRSLTPEENIVLFLARHRRLSDQGAIHAVNEGERLHQFTTFLVSMHPDVKDIVARYHFDTDTAARTFDALLAATRLGLSRLPEQPSLATHGGRVYAAQADAEAAETEPNEDEASAYAATAPSKGGGRPARKLTPAELEKFYESCPEGKYCFLHGWWNHLGVNCGEMKAKKSTYTPAQISLEKPTYLNGKLKEVSGVLPNISVRAGFRHPA